MIIGIFGDCMAPDKLVRAALNDTLEAHNVDAPDEEFWLCLGMQSDSPAVYRTIAQWALANGTYVAYYTSMQRADMSRVLDLNRVEDFHRSDTYMLELVNRMIHEVSTSGGSGKVYALLGEKKPSVEVRRALVRALDNGLEVRDLAEAGLTYVGVSDNPLTIGSIIMANDLTLAEAGEAADNEDEESMTALTTLAADYGLDPDEYETWVALADALDPLMAAAPEPEPDEPEEAPTRRTGNRAALSRDELEELSVPELRQLAKQLGIEGWDKNRSAKLIDGVIAAQGDGPVSDGGGGDEETGVDGDVEGDSWLMAMLAKGLRAFADAIDR